MHEMLAQGEIKTATSNVKQRKMRVPLSATVRPREKEDITKQKSFELVDPADQIRYDLGATVVVEDGEVFRAKDDDIEKALGVASKAEVFGDTNVGDWLKMVIGYPTNEYMDLLLKAKKDAEKGEAESKDAQPVEPEKGVAEEEGAKEARLVEAQKGENEARPVEAEKGVAEAEVANEAQPPEAEKGTEGEKEARPVEAEKGAAEGEEVEAAAAMETGGGADSVEAIGDAKVTDDTVQAQCGDKGVHPSATDQGAVMEIDQLMAGLRAAGVRVAKSQVQLGEAYSAIRTSFVDESQKLDKYHREQYERLRAHIRTKKEDLSRRFRVACVPHEVHRNALRNEKQMIQYNLQQLEEARQQLPGCSPQKRLLEEGGCSPRKRLCVQGQSKVTAAPSGWIGGTGAPTTIPAQRIANVPLEEWPFIQGPSVPAAQGTAAAGFAAAGMVRSSADAGAAFMASPLAQEFVPLYKTNVAAARGGAAPGPDPSSAANPWYGGAAPGPDPSSAANLVAAHGGAAPGPAPSSAANLVAAHGGAAFGHTPSSAANLDAARGGAGFGPAPSGPAANLAGANTTQKWKGGGITILSVAAQVVDGACEIVRKEMGREQQHQTSPPKNTGSERHAHL